MMNLPADWFSKGLIEASKEVAAWPAWKQAAMQVIVPRDVPVTTNPKANMTQAFNPFQAPAPAAPTAPAAAARTQAVPTDMNDPTLFDGIGAPYFRHIDGEFDLRVDGYAGTTAAQTPKKGRSVHLTLTVMTSSVADIPVGSTWRISYAYNWEHSEKSDKDTYGAEMRKLADFIHALAKQPRGAGFDAKACERSLHSHDWKAQPGYVHLSAALGKPKPDGSGNLIRYRNDTWLPVAGAA